jgi:hypothetical protein
MKFSVGQKLVQGPSDKSKFLAASKIKSQRQSFGASATCPDLIDSQAVIYGQLFGDNEK